MASKITYARAAVRCNSHVDALDGGDVRFRSGAPPTNADDAASGTMIVTLPLNATAFGAASNQSPGAQAAMLTTPTAVSAVAAATATAGYAEWRTSGGTVVAVETITGTGGGGDIELDNTSIASGQTVTLSAYNWDEPES